MSEEIETPDFNQCQGWTKPGPFTLGPREWTRCKNKPTVVAKYDKGKNTLCDKCVEDMKEQLGEDYAVLLSITSEYEATKGGMP